MAIDVTRQYDEEQVAVLVSLRKDIIHQLVQTGSPSAIRSFLGRCAIMALDTEERVITLWAPNDFVLSQVKKFFASPIKSIVRSIYKQDYRVEYFVHPDFQHGDHPLQIDLWWMLAIDDQKISKTHEQQIKKELSDYFGILFDPIYSFDTLIVGNHNQLAAAAAEAVVKEPWVAYNPLFIYGDVGLGKTHIMQAIGNQLLKSDPSKVIVYLPTTKFLDHIINAIKKGGLTQLLKKFEEVDVLLLDDIQFIAGADKTQEIFHNIFNDFHLQKKQIVISSDRPPKELNNIADRLKSRFALWLVADIQAPDFETRSAILQSKIMTKWLHLLPAMVDILSQNLTSNVREIEGAVTMLATKQHLYGRELQIDDIYDVLRTLGYDTANPLHSRQVSSSRLWFDELVDFVVDYLRIEKDKLLGEDRHKSLVIARKLLMIIAKEQYGWTLEKIGDYFGGKNHATVIYAIKTIKKTLATDEYIKSDYALFVSKIEGK
jgi:chromosomal replication initiator protein